MNRLGINLWNWSNNPQDNVIELISRASAIGFTAVEIPMLESTLNNTAQIRSKLNEKELEVTLCACMNTGRDISSFDGEIRKSTAKYFSECIEAAAELGAKAFVGPLFSGGGKCHLLSPEDKKTEWELAASGIKTTASFGLKYGITLCVEPLHRYRTSVVNTAKQAIKLVSDIDMQNVKILYDTFHANIEETDVCASLEDVLKAKMLGHFHACANNRGASGTGHLPWEKLFTLLKNYNYLGHITMESFCVGGFDAMWNSISESPDELAETGISNLKKYYTDKNREEKS
jgi:D-psicose/D-tagatose/L-ribulose 3-epimerase